MENRLIDAGWLPVTPTYFPHSVWPSTTMVAGLAVSVYSVQDGIAYPPRDIKLNNGKGIILHLNLSLPDAPLIHFDDSSHIGTTRITGYACSSAKIVTTHSGERSLVINQIQGDKTDPYDCTYWRNRAITSMHHIFSHYWEQAVLWQNKNRPPYSAISSVGILIEDRMWDGQRVLPKLYGRGRSGTKDMESLREELRAKKRRMAGRLGFTDEMRYPPFSPEVLTKPVDTIPHHEEMYRYFTTFANDRTNSIFHGSY